MILVTIGNSTRPFPRLLDAMDEIAREEREEVVMQVGRTGFQPSWATSIGFVSRKDFGHLVRRARVVVTDGGVGAFLEAVRAGKPVVIFPRLRQLHEVIDDQAQDFISAIVSTNLASVCRSVEELRSALFDPDDVMSRPLDLGRGRTQLTSRLRETLLCVARRERCV